MVFKILASLVAIVLFAVFTGAAVVKLKEWSLVIVTLIGLAMMLMDLWQSVQSKDE